MKIQSSLNRIRNQLSGMERMIRTLRAEIESQISAYAPDDVAAVGELETGLGKMFAEAAPLAPFSAINYQPFVPGVWVGMDSEVGECGVTVALKALHSHDPLQGNARVARLSLNPVFPLVEKPRWVTLECDADIAALQAAKGLRLDMVSFFDISPLNTVAIPRNVIIKLRIKKADGTFTDKLGYSVPVSTMPFEHTVLVPDMKTAEIDTAGAKSAHIIIVLPQAGDYTFHMDHFSLKTIGA
jgi:hypothetical protein